MMDFHKLHNMQLIDLMSIMKNRRCAEALSRLNRSHLITSCVGSKAGYGLVFEEWTAFNFCVHFSSLLSL